MKKDTFDFIVDCEFQRHCHTVKTPDGDKLVWDDLEKLVQDLKEHLKIPFLDYDEFVVVSKNDYDKLRQLERSLMMTDSQNESSSKQTDNSGIVYSHSTSRGCPTTSQSLRSTMTIYFDVDGVLWHEKFSYQNSKWIERYKGMPRENNQMIKFCQMLIQKGYHVGIISRKWTNPWKSDKIEKEALKRKLGVKEFYLIEQNESENDFHFGVRDVLIDWKGIAIAYDDRLNKAVTRQSQYPIVNQVMTFDEFVKVLNL